MKTTTMEERAAALRQTMTERRRDLGAALVTLGDVGTEQFTLGGHLAKNPWPWLLAACALGLFWGLDQPAQPTERRPYAKR